MRAAASCLAYSTAHLLLILLLTAMMTHHLGWVNDARGIVIRSSRAAGHVLIEVVHARLDGVRSVVTARKTLIVDHHAVNLLRHVHLVIARLALLLVGLALLAIAVLVEARSGTTSNRLFLLLNHVLLLLLLLLLRELLLLL